MNALTAPYGESYVEIPEPLETYRVSWADDPCLIGTVLDETDRKAFVDWGERQGWEWWVDLRRVS